MIPFPLNPKSWHQYRNSDISTRKNPKIKLYKTSLIGNIAQNNEVAHEIVSIGYVIQSNQFGI